VAQEADPRQTAATRITGKREKDGMVHEVTGKGRNLVIMLA
jgi:hypothetical protein